MSYPKEILAAARARLEQDQRDKEQTFAEHMREAYAKCPRLREIDSELRTTMAQVVAIAFKNGEDVAEAIAQVKERNLELNRERDWLVESEFEEGYLDNTPVCPKCDGSGYVGANMCECLQSLCCQEQKKAISRLIGTGREKFSAFKLDYYSTSEDPEIGTSPRNLMRENLELCRSYANGFSEHAESLLFTGKPGLGKTFLSACIARVVADRGFSVVYDTVIQVLSDYETVKFGANTEENRKDLDKYIQADLLIIDDLGTEMVTQFTISALYHVINSRIIYDKPTIISTNLSPQMIQERYSPQLYSRLLGVFKLVFFRGEDIRMRGKF